MFYRFALGVGLLLLGAFVGREVSRTRPVRQQLKARRRQVALLPQPAAPTRKVWIH